MKYLYQKFGKSGYGKTKSIEIANELLNNNCKELNSYKKITPRVGGYFVPEHQDKIKKKINEASINQAEKKKFREAVINNYANYTIDYEINIAPGEKQNIDVLFIYDGTLFIGEGKGPKASGDEPLLRAVLEIETYSRLIVSEQLFSDFLANIPWVKKEVQSNILKKSVILFEKKDGKESPMFRQLYQDEYSPIHNLMRKLKVYAIKAESFCQQNGKVEFFKGFSPLDY